MWRRVTTVVEFRTRSKRAPGGELRIFLGRASNGRERRELEARRDVLSRLATRGDWGVLCSIKDREYTPEEVERLVDEHGIGDFKAHLPATGVALSVDSLDARKDQWLPTLDEKRQLHQYRWGIGKLCDTVLNGQRLGDSPFNAIGKHHIKDAIEVMKVGLTRNSVKGIVISWSAFYTWAVDRDESESETDGRERLIVANPVRKAKLGSLLTSRPTRHRFLSEDEFRVFIDTAPDMMKAQYATLTLAGLRINEFMHLPTAHVRLPTHIHIGPWGNWAPKGYPRYDRGVRDIPIHKLLLPLLEEYAERWAGEDTFFVNPVTQSQWHGPRFRERYFYRDVKAAGMVPGARRGGEALHDGITPHTLRHTLASWLAQRDVQLMKIAQLLGDTEQTIRLYYAHLLPTDLDETIQRIL